MEHGTSLGELGRGLGTKENVLGEQEAKKLDRKWVWGSEVYLVYLKAGSFQKERQKGTLLPISLFHSLN